MRFGTRSLYDKHTRQSAAKHQTQWPLFTPRIRSLIALRLTQSRPVIQLRAAPNRRWSGVQEPYHLDEHNRECLAIGLVTLAFRSLNSLMRPFAQMPRGFCRLVMSGGGAGYRTH
jgi:hypothetical protein